MFKLASSMGQRLAKKHLDDALRLYYLQNYEEALKRWQELLPRLHVPDRFVTMSFMISAFSDTGQYGKMIEYATQQLDLASSKPAMEEFRSEAYLNLSRGYCYLVIAQALCDVGEFSKSLESFDHAMRLAKSHNDLTLQLQIYTGLGSYFLILRDFEKALEFYQRSESLGKQLGVCEQGAKYQRVNSLLIAHAYRKLGRFEEALSSCEEAMKMALDTGDRPTQAKCLCCLADILRSQNETATAYPRYETALKIMVEIGDRSGQVEVLAGMAKSLLALKEQEEVCECKILELNAKALEMATRISNKIQMLRCHMRMTDLYRSLGDFGKVDEQLRVCNSLAEEMELFCTVCNQSIANRAGRIDALACCHIYHARCADQLRKLYSSSPGSANEVVCPRCQRNQTQQPGTLLPDASNNTTSNQNHSSDQRVVSFQGFQPVN